MVGSMSLPTCPQHFSLHLLGGPKHARLSSPSLGPATPLHASLHALLCSPELAGSPASRASHMLFPAGNAVPSPPDALPPSMTKPGRRTPMKGLSPSPCCGPMECPPAEHQASSFHGASPSLHSQSLDHSVEDQPELCTLTPSGQGLRLSCSQQGSN